MVQPLISHKMLNAELSHNLAIPLLGIYPKEREKSHSWVYTQKKGKNPTPRYIPERNENICPHENLYRNVHMSVIHDGQKVGTAPGCVRLWVDKQNVVYY